jgi:DNA-binding protein HU-beta
MSDKMGAAPRARQVVDDPQGLRPSARRDSVEKSQQTKGESLPMASRPATTTKKVAVPKAVAKRPEKAAPAPKAARMAAPKKVAETVTLKAVFEQLAVEHEMPKKQAHALAAGLVDRVTGILQNGDRLRMSGLGIIEVKDRPARMGRNPATGAAVQIAASKKVAFRAAKELKAAV